MYVCTIALYMGSWFVTNISSADKLTIWHNRKKETIIQISQKQQTVIEKKD